MSTAKERSNERENPPQERVIVRNPRLHLYPVHDFLPNIESRNDPSDHEPHPRIDEVDARAFPSTSTEHVVAWVQPLLRLSINGFEEAFWLERVWIGVGNFIPCDRPMLP